MTSDQSPPAVCEVCGRPPVFGPALFRLPHASGAAWHCERCALRQPRLVRPAIKTAAVVGTLLALINHGSVYWTGPVTGELLAKTALTYCVPFGVAMWGALMANRRRIAREPMTITFFASGEPISDKNPSGRPPDPAS
ncbi:MAG: nitrate/nitrite transporter NrtS [Thermaerobacter sp.]|nr:nitrate/nitrite transporter NrtS [Thermaerobacter sp.]